MYTKGEIQLSQFCIINSSCYLSKPVVSHLFLILISYSEGKKYKR